MRILIISDIHGNLPALEAVLKVAANKPGYDRAWVLGDTVGYGPQPNECLARIKNETNLVIAGNHEKAVIGQMGIEDFNPVAAAALVWTRKHMTPEATEFTRSMPERIESDGFTLVHGSPRDPLWEYLSSPVAAVDNLTSFSTRACACGHTHVPMWVSVRNDRVKASRIEDRSRFEIARDRYYLNPGSVGQPRDGDPRASYALLDTDTASVTFHRAEYDVEATQKLIEATGLPMQLAYRLSVGR